MGIQPQISPKTERQEKKKANGYPADEDNDDYKI
jgi:hypothetical protein